MQSAGKKTVTLALGGSLEPLFPQCQTDNETEPDPGNGPCLGGSQDSCLRIAWRENLTRQETEMSVERMKRLFTTCVVLGCLSFSFAQGLQGNVRLSGNATVSVTGHSVTLTWSASQNATSYNIYRGSRSGGPYVRLASGIVSTTYSDVQVTHNQTIYYVVTAVNGSSESAYSIQIVAVIP